jgi:hypothetical protein
LSWTNPTLFFVGLALALLLMIGLILVLMRFLRALLRRWRRLPAPA